jgi:hypothetical protein
MFILSGVSDLFAVSSMEEVSRGYWDAQSPVRMAFFACVTGYTYIFRPGRGNTAASHPLKNSLVFTWGFMEVLAWFWVCPSSFLLLPAREIANLVPPDRFISNLERNAAARRRGLRSGEGCMRSLWLVKLMTSVGNDLGPVMKVVYLSCIFCHFSFF